MADSSRRTLYSQEYQVTFTPRCMWLQMRFQRPTELNKEVTSLFMLQLNNIVFVSLSVRKCVFPCLQKLKFIWQARSCFFFCRFNLFVVMLDVGVKQQLQVEFYCYCWSTSRVVGMDGTHFIYEQLYLALLNASKVTQLQML